MSLELRNEASGAATPKGAPADKEGSEASVCSVQSLEIVFKKRRHALKWNFERCFRLSTYFLIGDC